MLPRMSLRAFASAPLALCGLLACSGPAPAPQAAPVAAAPSSPAPADASKSAAPDDGEVSLLPARNSPRPAPEPPLTQEELDLLAADPATLTPELRRKRGYAVRRKIMQNPDSPTARQLEALRLATERGEITPQLPNKTVDNGLVLHARTPPDAPAPAQPDAPGSAPKPSP